MLRFCYALLLSACVTLTAKAVTVSTTPSQCTANNGTATANASGGTLPYTYAWSNGETTSQITSLAPGTYSVTVTDALGEESSASGVVEGQLNDPTQVYGWLLYLCPDDPMWSYYIQADVLGGTPPFTSPNGVYWPNQGQMEWLIEDGNPEAHTSDLHIEDANGCFVDFYVQINVGSINEIFGITTAPSCNSEANGSASVRYMGHGWYGDSNLSVYDSTGQSVFYKNQLDPDGGYQAISGLLPGQYKALVISNFPDCQLTYYRDSTYFTIADLGENCGTISGTLYVDTDADCINDAAEPKIPYAMLSIQPGDGLTFTGADGRYNHNLLYGSYTLSHVSSQYVQLCPPVSPISFTVSGTTTSIVQDIADSSLAGHDIAMYVSNGPARPGFVLNAWLNVTNTSLYPSGDLSLLYLFDPALELISADPAPTGSTMGLLQWDLPALAAYGRDQVHLQFQVPPDPGLIGTELAYMASVENVDNTVTEANMDNNLVSGQITVTGSFDPNDKLVRTSSGNTSLYFDGEDEYLDYTIRFQNTGTDTAFTVMIRDTIAPELDLLSTEILASSHAMTADVRNPRTLTFTFAEILLPDSGTNEAASHGFVSFRIKPVTGLQPGSVLSNQADIYFDFNPPVITEPNVVTVALPGVYISVKAYLAGAAGETTPGLMMDGLRNAGLLPTTEPYSALGYSYEGTGAGASVQTEVLEVSGNNAIVDWVVVELRSDVQPSLVVASTPALLQRDGDLVATNGNSPVYFNMPADEYYVAVRHRNHLGIMTGLPMALGNSVKPLDFTDPSTPTYGTDAQWERNGIMVLWPGDVTQSGTVTYTGSGNDRDAVLNDLGGSDPIHFVTDVYSLTDVNLDGKVKYTGARNDRDVILQAIGGVLSTTVRTEQLP